jgi:hypothetical protein
MKIKKPRIAASNKRIYNRVKKMCLSAFVMGTVAYVSEHYFKFDTDSFISTDPTSFSGLYVNADVLGFEGERKLEVK